MALERFVELPAPPARVAGLLAAALPMPTGWERGVTFPTTGCIAPWVVGECPGAGVTKPTDRPSSALFRPVAVGVGIECTAAGAPNGLDATVELDATIEHALAHELATAEASTRDASDGVGNPSLTSAVTSDHGDAADLTAALACLEAGAYTARSGRPVWLHVDPVVATHLFDVGLVYRDGTRWRTVNGSTVVVSSGYLALDAVASTTTRPIVATAPVYAGVGQRDVMASIDRAVNTVETRVEDVAIVAFDPCYVGVVGSSVAACADPTPVTPATVTPSTGGSGTGTGGTGTGGTGTGGSGSGGSGATYTAPTGCGDWGTYAAQAGAPSGDGELQILAGGVKIHAVNNGGIDLTAEFHTLAAGDTVYVLGQDGHVEVTLTGPVTDEAGQIISIGGTVATDGTPPSASDAVHLCVTQPTQPPGPPTGVQPGQPGSFTPPGADVPADLPALQALGDLGQTAAWATDAYVALGDSSDATWDGSAWSAWTAP